MPAIELQIQPLTATRDQYLAAFSGAQRGLLTLYSIVSSLPFSAALRAPMASQDAQRQSHKNAAEEGKVRAHAGRGGAAGQRASVGLDDMGERSAPGPVAACRPKLLHCSGVTMRAKWL